MKSLQIVLSAVAVLVGLAAFPAPAQEAIGVVGGVDNPDLPLLVFRGVTPGRTTETALLKHPQWGKPDSRESKDGTTLLRYKTKLQKVVAVRDGVVRSIDVLFPAGTKVDDVVSVLKLKDPLPYGQLPPAAWLFGEPISPTLEHKQFGIGRVVLFVQQGEGRPVAKRVRFYAMHDSVTERAFEAWYERIREWSNTDGSR